MIVKELLDKQYELPSIILVNEDYDCGKYVCASRMCPNIKNQQKLDEFYEKYGRREVEWFSPFLSTDNRIIMLIQLVKET